MPIYEYECQECNKVTEVWQNMSDEQPTSCPECNGTDMKKIISSSSFQLKGGGWYADGYCSSNQSSCKSKSAASSSSKKESSCPCASS